MDFPAPGPGVPRRAAVSSFGIGGTNAHVVLEEPPPVEAAAPSRAVQLLLLSARTAGELEEMTSRLARHLQAKPDICVADVAYTLQVGRKEFPYRRMALCRSREEAVSALEARTPQRVVTALASSSARPIVFLFPGQGSQHVDMGAGLYESERCFRDAVDRCADFLRPQLGLDLRSAMFSRDGQAAEAQLERTELAQPALFIIAYALAQQLSSFGIRPRAMIGHSIGEYVAACLAGVFALEDALTLVAERGRLMQSMPPGGMLAVELAERELLPLLGENLTLGGRQCAVALRGGRADNGDSDDAGAAVRTRHCVPAPAHLSCLPFPVHGPDPRAIPAAGACSDAEPAGDPVRVQRHRQLDRGGASNRSAILGQPLAPHCPLLGGGSPADARRRQRLPGGWPGTRLGRPGQTAL